MGPPVAIKIILGVPPAGTDPEQANDQNLKTYQHTVAIITANGTTPATTTTGTTSSSTTSTTGN
jgi:hypothetical protein